MARAVSSPNVKTTTTSAPATAAPETPRARRRVPALVLGLGGAVIAAAYGLVFEKIRFGPPLVMIALGGLALVLSALALWRMIDPLSRADAPAAPPPRAPQRLRELEREKQLVLKAIKEIELDYNMRKIAEADYREMIERYRARAMRLISELEAGDNYRALIERELRERLAALGVRGDLPARPNQGPDRGPEQGLDHDQAAASPAPATAGCAACGTRNDEDAQFCKKCGGKLALS